EGGGDGNGRSVLVVMEHRDVHARAQLALDLEALRCLDVFKVDAAKSGLERGDDLDQGIRVGFVDLDIENVDACKLLEQDGLAFHDGLGGQRANGSQSQHCRAVCDDTDKVATGGVAEYVGRIVDDLFASCCYAG